MSDQDKESKTEQPSAKRREDALKDGGAPQSRDLSSTVSLLVGVASTLLSRMAVPVLYYMAERHARAAHAKAA